MADPPAFFGGSTSGALLFSARLPIMAGTPGPEFRSAAVPPAEEFRSAEPPESVLSRAANQPEGGLSAGGAGGEAIAGDGPTGEAGRSFPMRAGCVLLVQMHHRNNNRVRELCYQQCVPVVPAQTQRQSTEQVQSLQFQTSARERAAWLEAIQLSAG